MRMTGLHFFHTAPSGEHQPDSTPAPLATYSPSATWQQVHHVIATNLDALSTPEELAGAAVYYFCTYQVFGQPADAALSQRFLTQVLAQLTGSYTSDHLAHVCSVAWLHTQLEAANLALPEADEALEQLDKRVFAAAEQLMALPSAAHTGSIVHILRYFYLRLPTPAASAHLNYILAWQTALTQPWLPAKLHTPRLPLGLNDGLAANLLVLLNILKAGVTSQALQQYVQQGIRLLLSVKREVDFLDQRYSVFPDWLEASNGEALFSDEISWPRGDIGQSLLLYEAHQFLQDAELANVAELVGLNTLLRVSMQSTQVTTAQFYQGAAGVAYLYQKLSSISGQMAYQKGYTFWLHQLQHRVHQELAAGFYQGRTGQLQQGLAGVGLVLLSAIAPTPLYWDKIIL